VGCGFGEGAAEARDGGALRGLGVNDKLAGDGGGDEGAVGGAFHLLDGVDGGGGDDGGAVLFDGGDGALDGGGVDEGADGIVDEDDVLRGGGGEGGESVGDGLLAVVAAGDDVDFFGEMVLVDHGGYAVLFGVADGNVDSGDGRDGEEGAQRVDDDGEALEGQELLRRTARGVGHAGADSSGGDDYEDRHGNRSITLRGCQLLVLSCQLVADVDARRGVSTEN